MDIMYSVQVLNRAFKTFFKVLDRNSWITGSSVRNLKCEMDFWQVKGGEMLLI